MLGSFFTGELIDHHENAKTILYRFVTVIAIIWQYHTAHAKPPTDSPAPEFDYIQEVGDGEFVFVMLSIKDDPTAYGQGGAVQDEDIRRQYSQSGLYQNDGSTTPLWTVDWYAFQIALSMDGKYLVRWGPWPFHDNYDELALAFYKNGLEIQRYAVKDLVADPTSLPRSISHYGWAKETSFDTTMNVLHLETHNGEEYDFDVTTGKKLTASASSLPIETLLAVIAILIFCGTFVLWKRIRENNAAPNKPAT